MSNGSGISGVGEQRPYTHTIASALTRESRKPGINCLIALAAEWAVGPKVPALTRRATAATIILLVVIVLILMLGQFD